MRSVPGYLAIVFCLTASFALAQQPQPMQTPAPSPTPILERPTYDKLLEWQTKSAELTIQTVVQQQNALQAISQIIGVLWVVFATICGFFLKKLWDKVELELSERRHDLDNIRNELVEKRNQADALFSEHEEKLKDCVVVTALVKFRSDLLLSTNVDVRWRATQGISELATRPGGAIALPILLECLQKPNEEVKVVKEALYGLRHRGKEIMDDSQAIQIIATLSTHPTASVRLETVILMGKIGPTHTKFQQCLQRCSERDPDTEVQAEARQIIQATTV